MSSLTCFVNTCYLLTYLRIDAHTGDKCLARFAYLPGSHVPRRQHPLFSCKSAVARKNIWREISCKVIEF